MPRDIAIIGGGPAGLRAAEVAAVGGARVTLYDATRSVGRKFLVAGKSGLNLTHDLPPDRFASVYRGGPGFSEAWWREMLAGFDPMALREWASGLGVETFVASSGKVFPVPVGGRIRAAPLLRRWVERLRARGVVFRMGHRWEGFAEADGLIFHATDGRELVVSHGAVVLALGGGSWPETGSTGGWLAAFQREGIVVRPLVAANCGWEVDWPPAVLEEAEGEPLKNLLVSAGDGECRGELVITRHGLEGGPIYHLGPVLREMAAPELRIDFKPDLSLETLVTRLGGVRRNFAREAGRRLGVSPGARALLKHLPDRGPWRSAEDVAGELKACRIPLLRPRPLVEAISSAGGVSWAEVDDSLMLRRRPGVFVAGEMLDWEAPTGGFLMQGCFATGERAARSAMEW